MLERAMAERRIVEAVEWYKQNYSTFKSLAATVDSIVRQVLDQKGINYHSITNRPKEIDRYREKASKEKYDDPRSQIMDMAGVRIITYIDSDAKKVKDIIEELFEIIPEYSKDKAQDLGTDRMGYRSIHCVCKLGNDRLALQENKIYENLLFEIQIRTILQHAWAEFEHNRNYKFKGVLPDETKRRLAIVAGNLELMDWTFESISRDIDDYTAKVMEKTKSGDLNTQITSASLSVYLPQKFSKLLEKGLLKPNNDEEYDIKMVSELSDVGIITLEQLDKAIPKDIIEMSIKYNLATTYLGLVRDVMIISNIATYFEKAWKASWNQLDKESVRLLKHYGCGEESLKKYLRKHSKTAL